MAATTAAAQITEAHRLAQARLGAQTAAQVRAVFPLLDLADLDATFARWLQAVVPLVQANRTASSTLAANYYRAFRAVDAGIDATAAFAPVLAPPAALDAVTGAMVITGPASIKRALTRGVPLTKAAEVAEASSAAVAQFHALTGGRDTIAATVAADDRALGWARTTSGRCCAFCAMLASRGFVYSENTVDFEAHPGCSCSAEPTFTRSAQLPPGSAGFKQAWDDATRDLPRGENPLNAFRQHLAA